MKYKATIIGCGSIGAIKPDQFDSPNSNNVLTHANACWQNPSIELNGFFDININNFSLACNKWLDIKPGKEFKPFESDIYIIANNTITHKDSLLKVLEYNPELVIAEKPLGNNLAECQEIVNAYKKANVPLVVNYTRRYSLGFQQQYTKLKCLFGGKIKAQSAILHYDRGLVRDGCHGIDLINWFLGDVISCKRLSDYDIIDHEADDPTFGVLLETENCPHVIMLPSDGRHYSKFEFDIWHELGRVRFVEYGQIIEETPRKIEDTYGGGVEYFSLSKPVYTNSSLTKSMSVLYDNVVSYLDDPEHTNLLCTGENALQVWEVLNRLI